MDLGEPQLRFNWQTPIMLSKHHQDIFYYGSNKLYRSFNKGDTTIAMSPDLTNGGKPGDVPYGTLTTLLNHRFVSDCCMLEQMTAIFMFQKMPELHGHHQQACNGKNPGGLPQGFG